MVLMKPDRDILRKAGGLGDLPALVVCGLAVQGRASRPGHPDALLLVLLATLFFAAHLAAADDIVILKPGGTARSPRRVTGTITEYTGREIFIRLPSGNETMLPADRVDEISTKYTGAHIEADGLMRDNKFVEALARYQQAADEEERRWVRRQILVQTVWCHRALGQFDQAAATFRLIVESDRTTQHFDAIPLAWHPMRLSLAMERRGAEWVRQVDDAVAQLIAASWLLSGPARMRSEALRALERLTQNRDRRIAQLAEAQLWRSRVVTAGEDEIRRWQAAIERMSESLRAGPYFLYGRLLARHGRQQDAALAFMRVPILYSRNRHLAAESLLAAAKALEKAGQKEQSHICLRELVGDYPDSEAAAAAKSTLQRASTGG